MTGLVALAGAGYTGRADRLIIAAGFALLVAWVAVMAWRDARRDDGPWEPLP